MKKLTLVSFVATLLSGTAAFADTPITVDVPAGSTTTETHSVVSEPATPAATTDSDSTSVTNVTTTTSSDSDVARYVTPDSADYVVSSLINAKVMNNAKETIGEIKDLVVRDNSIEGVVIAVGGFLGLGERYVVVDPSTMHMHVDKGVWHVTTNATKDTLLAAPEFRYVGHWAR